MTFTTSQDQPTHPLGVPGGVPGKPSPDQVGTAVYDNEQSGRAATYPYRAGFKEDTTSRMAADAIEATGRAQELRELCMSCLRDPATPKDIAKALGEEITSIRPRLTELLQQGLITRTGLSRSREHILVRV